MEWIQRISPRDPGRLTLPRIAQARRLIAEFAPPNLTLGQLRTLKPAPPALLAAILGLCFGGLIVFQHVSGHSLVGKARLADRIVRGDVAIKLEPVVEGLTAPNWATPAPGLADHLFVVDQVGLVWVIDLGENSKSVFLDVRESLVPLGFAGAGTYDERGLLGLAFHPDYASNGLFYTTTSEPASDRKATFPVPADGPANHHSVISEWVADDPSDPTKGASTLSRRELMRIGQPQFNHNGGALGFGPDGYLYISVGDGGGGNDMGAGHTEFVGNGQDTTNILGAILRIDTGSFNSANGEYGIPFDNPFIGHEGFPDEIYAHGFRNPSQFSIDGKGDLYVGDVGQNAIEEINLVSPTDAGANYGWNSKEGSFCFDVDSAGDGFAFETDSETGLCPDLLDDGTLVDPIAEYDNELEGYAVIGGAVYRGTAIAGLLGRYVFADFSSAFDFMFNDPERTAFNRPVVKSTAAPGRLFYLSEAGDILEFRGDSPAGAVLGLGQDAAGELYVLGNRTATPNGATGTVHRIVARE